MQLGDSPATTRDPRSPADEILDNLNNNLTELLTAIDSGALDHLEAAEKIALGRGSKPSATDSRSSITG